MTSNINETLEFAIAAARAAAPNLPQTELDAAVTAATKALVGQTRSMQVALRTSTESAAAERNILTAAQVWVGEHNSDDLSELKEILGGHVTYGFDPAGAPGLDPVIVAEAATEAHLREFARAEQLQRIIDAS